VDSGESSRTWALLSLGSARAVGTLGAGQDAAGSNNQDVAVGELLLELTGEALLGLVPALEKGNRDKDDDSLAAMSNLDLRILVSANCRCPVPIASSIKICRYGVFVRHFAECGCRYGER